jgi:hypothetical protein
VRTVDGIAEQLAGLQAAVHAMVDTARAVRLTPCRPTSSPSTPRSRRRAPARPAPGSRSSPRRRELADASASRPRRSRARSATWPDGPGSS